MNAQLEHLKRLDREFSLFTFKVVSFRAGKHLSLGGAYAIFEFEGEEFPKTVYLESLEGARYIERPERVASFQRAHDDSAKKADPIKDYTPS